MIFQLQSGECECGCELMAFDEVWPVEFVKVKGRRFFAVVQRSFAHLNCRILGEGKRGETIRAMHCIQEQAREVPIDGSCALYCEMV